MLDFIGYFGMFLFVVMLILSRKRYRLSQLVNILSGICLLTYSLLLPTYPMAILNMICIPISLFNLMKSGEKKNE